jgi:quercetin dioxygenase-like cupin family protein
MTHPLASIILGAVVATVPGVPLLGAQQGAPQRPGYHVVTVPLTAGAGVRQETKILVETAHLKLASVTLRQGAVLEEHSSPMPVTIQVISGRGVVTMEGASEVIAAGAVLVLAPGMKHVVRPEAASDMILLVHHLKSPQTGPRPPKGGS